MDQSKESYIKGRPVVTIFHNDQNLYTVLKIKVEETNENYSEKNAVVTGYFPRLHDEEQYTFYGTFQKHPKYGLQFVSTHFRKDLPKTKQGIIQYLSSELFKGIGKKTAESIVETLGENAISRILESPSLLDTVPKLPSEKAKLLYDKLVEHQGLEKVMVALNEYGFGPQLSMRIYQTYKEETLNMITANPYKLVEDVEGIGFGRADELGFKLGIQGNHPDRMKAACLYSLETDCLQEGHSFLYRDSFLSSVKKLLEENQQIEIQLEEIDRELLKLEEEGKIIAEENRVYIPSIFFSEKGLTKNIKRILAQRDDENEFPDSEFFIALGELEERLGIEYAPSQREAIQTALTSPMLILTGGPGTGKTTVIKGIVELYAQLHGCSLNPEDYTKEEPFPVILAAPTGRAAKRMSESTGLPAVTIHRLLGWNGMETFDYNEDNPIEGKLIIVDEMSMVDIWLAHHLFKALPEKIQVVLVGDEDQLPSVGPGQVLKDLLDSNKIPTVRLKDIYRQENGSSIIELAHHIKNGTIPTDLVVQKKDRSFITCTSAQMGDVIKQIVSLAAEKGFTKRDIQVLAPMYRGPAGIDKLNEILQELLNPVLDQKKRQLVYGDVTYRVGDKVLQLVNRPEDNVFNGDIGEIRAIFFAKENEERQDQLVVSFEGNEVIYTKQDLNQMTLAYCCSIHKSQGSEFPIVILPVVRSYYRMLRRNLIYTAVTRSKNKLILCGEEDAFKMAVMRTDDSLRNSSLKERLETTIQQEKERDKPLLSYEEKLMETDPMVGMENTTPFDFINE
ncbi:ATP-dependent RecD-like DNA helicase [Fervidibacillus albus]|uniref:ATP-dependent RecD2 DNA helicase n=1 Tax=Fervidibacillus albus TaxID=2980026 RepID=A0A9E8LV66_9BACI|nr:ATP-dependent RecD-like DNA helicase [Fervidibacillus albus]WAA10283.1 ATP-dependent RecD-like DNA helicase [Fervidibacillus albus]